MQHILLADPFALELMRLAQMQLDALDLYLFPFKSRLLMHSRPEFRLWSAPSADQST
jgi:hypothetical protein